MQEQLAERANRHFTYMGRIERGEKKYLCSSIK